MKIANFLKNSFVLLGEFLIFIVSFSWLYSCKLECHEPLITVISSLLPLIVGVSMRVFDWFKKSAVQQYCENLHQQYRTISLPLMSDDLPVASKTKYSLAENVDISDIYIDLPLTVVAQAPILSNGKKRKFPFFGSKKFKIIQRIGRLWGKQPEGKKGETTRRSFTKYAESTEDKTILSTTTINSVLEKSKKVIIVGDRGSGKSTLLKYLAYAHSYQIANSKNFYRDNSIQSVKTNLIPIIIRCDSLNLESTINFSLILRQHLSGLQLQDERLNSLNEEISSALTRGNLMILIDAIDEINNIDLRLQFCTSLCEFAQAYPNITVIITCIENVFSGVRGCFNDRFEVVEISRLTLEHKKRFIQQWAQKFEHKAEAIEDLQNALITSRNLEGLTNNVQALSLIVQLPNVKSLLQVNFSSILREVIKQLVEKSKKQLKEDINTNEVTINLSEIAFFMSSHKNNVIEKSEIIKIVNATNQQAITNLGYEPHSPQLLLMVFNKHMGILDVAYQEPDSTGIERTFYKFIHSIFQDFFRVQAMMKHFNMRDVLSQLAMTYEQSGDDTVSVNDYLMPDSNASSNPKLVISELPPEKAEEVLLTILYPQNHIDTEKSRTRVIFGANLLTAAPSVSKDIAIKVINALLEIINPDIDGKGNTIKTPLDEAIYNLLHSPWGDVFEASLFEAFISSVGDKRIVIGSIISAQIFDNLDIFKTISIQDFYNLIDPQINKPETEQVFERLKLMSFAFYQHQGKYTGYFDNPETTKLYDLLLDFRNTSRATQMASIWALGWMLNAKDNYFTPKVKLNEAQVCILMEYLSYSDNDSYGLYWANLCLSRFTPVALQPDWTYEWATLADCHCPQSDLSLPVVSKINNIDNIINLLKRIITLDYHSLAKEGAVLTLGRLGYYPVEAIDWLLRIFEDPKYPEMTRKEALCYLAQVEDRTVAQRVYSIYKTSFVEKNEFKTNYTYLALLGIGDLNILKEIIDQGIFDLYEPGNMYSAFFALKTNKNKSGARALLNELKKSEIPEIRAVAKVGLMDFTGQSKAKAVESAITEIAAGELDSDASGVAEKTVCILLVRGEKPEGEAIFAYVAVRADKLEEFMEAQKSGIFYPEDYGVIVESGEGEPSDEIMKKMEDEYGFDHRRMIGLNE